MSADNITKKLYRAPKSAFVERDDQQIESRVDKYAMFILVSFSLCTVVNISLWILEIFISS